jgi:3-methylfumaryl-CoA hydratase
MRNFLNCRPQLANFSDRYATEVEGYPGLVVHGPLIATLLADLLRRHSSTPAKSLRFRAILLCKT